MKSSYAISLSTFAVIALAVDPPPHFTGDQSGIGSWFNTNAASSSTNGNSWCGYPYSNDQPLFAPVCLLTPIHMETSLIKCLVACLDGWFYLRPTLGSTDCRVLRPRSPSHQPCQRQIDAPFTLEIPSPILALTAPSISLSEPLSSSVAATRMAITTS